jgi:hypothetical protein
MAMLWRDAWVEWRRLVPIVRRLRCGCHSKRGKLTQLSCWSKYACIGSDKLTAGRPARVSRLLPKVLNSRKFGHFDIPIPSSVRARTNFSDDKVVGEPLDRLTPALDPPAALRAAALRSAARAQPPRSIFVQHLNRLYPHELAGAFARVGAYARRANEAAVGPVNVHERAAQAQAVRTVERASSCGGDVRSGCGEMTGSGSRTNNADTC